MVTVKVNAYDFIEESISSLFTDISFHLNIPQQLQQQKGGKTVIIICYFKTKNHRLHKIIRSCCRKLQFYISACKERYYGRNCSLVCFPNCKSDTCQQTDILCTCDAGWMGDNCTEGR